MSRPVNLAALLLMGIMWGLQFSMLKFAALSETGELDLLLVTLVFLVVVFAVYVWLRGDSLRLRFSWLPFLFVIALAGYVVPLGVTLWVAPHVTVGVLSLVACLAPVLTAAFALAFRTEKVSLRRILAMMLGLASVVLVLWSELQLPDRGAAIWILASMLITLAYGFEPVYVHAHWPKDMSAPQLIAGEAILATLMVFPVWIALGHSFDAGLLQMEAIWPLAIFALAGVVETLLYFYLIKTAGGIFVSFGTFVSLFAGIAWGTLLFSERHGAHVWLAVMFLVAALTLSLTGQSARTESSHGDAPEG